MLNNPGYSVRAASSDDRKLLDAAFRYPPYELPIDMWKQLPAAAERAVPAGGTAGPNNRVWAVHSAYLPKDTVGRDRSYFSHLLLLPDADPDAVLRSWVRQRLDHELSERARRKSFLTTLAYRLGR